MAKNNLQNKIFNYPATTTTTILRIIKKRIL